MTPNPNLYYDYIRLESEFRLKFKKLEKEIAVLKKRMGRTKTKTVYVVSRPGSGPL